MGTATKVFILGIFAMAGAMALSLRRENKILINNTISGLGDIIHGNTGYWNNNRWISFAGDLGDLTADQGDEIFSLVAEKTGMSKKHVIDLAMAATIRGIRLRHVEVS